MTSNQSGRLVDRSNTERPVKHDMGANVTLDRDGIEKIIEQAKLARAEELRRYGAALRLARRRMGSVMPVPQAIAIVAILLISFGVKMLFLSPPTAEADTGAVPSGIETNHAMPVDVK